MHIILCRRTHFPNWFSSLPNGFFKRDSSKDIRWSFFDLFYCLFCQSFVMRILYICSFGIWMSLDIALGLHNLGCSLECTNYMFILPNLSNFWSKCCVDDESSCSAVLKKEKDAKKSYVPRRLVIGKDEYVLAFIVIEYLNFVVECSIL